MSNHPDLDRFIDARDRIAAGLPLTAICPDCAFTERDTEHDDTCPAALALDAVTDADRVFFEEHPAATEYRRPIQPAEVTERRAWGLLPDCPGRAVGRVLVTQIEPGLRTRNFDSLLYLLIEPEGLR